MPQLQTQKQLSRAGESVVNGFRLRLLPDDIKAAPRVGHALLVVDNDFLIFGGRTVNGQHPSSVLAFSPRSLEWNNLRTLGAVPSGRTNHTAVLANNRVLVYGGNRFQEVFDDLYSLDISTLRWERINVSNAQSPGPVFGHSAVYVNAVETLFIAGGCHGRLHNMHLVHAFCAGKRREWKAIRGPPGVNPGELHQVAVTYNAAHQSIVVVGWESSRVSPMGAASDFCDGQSKRRITSRSDLSQVEYGSQNSHPDDGVGMVYLMNVHTCVWTCVATAPSPDSPIPFHLPSLWRQFIGTLYTMGEYYDVGAEEWYFPFSYAPSDIQEPEEAANSIKTSATDAAAQQHEKSARGFVRLNVKSMTWSLVSARLPRGMVHEMKKDGKSGGNSSLSGKRQNSQFGAGRGKGSSTRSNEAIKVLCPDGVVPPFERKYALASHAGSSKQKRTLAFTFLVVHGGLDLTQQNMLVMTPITGRAPRTHITAPSKDAFAAHHEVPEGDADDDNGVGSEFQQWILESSSAHSITSVTMYDSSKKRAMDDSLSDPDLMKQSTLYDDNEAMGASAVDPTFMTQNSRVVSSLKGVSTDSARNGGGGGSQNQLSSFTGANPSRNPNGVFARTDMTLSSARDEKAKVPPFNVLLHAHSSTTKGDLVEYEETSCPMVCISSEEAVEMWTQDFYEDQRAWLAQRLRHTDPPRMPPLVEKRSSRPSVDGQTPVGDVKDTAAGQSTFNANGTMTSNDGLSKTEAARRRRPTGRRPSTQPKSRSASKGSIAAVPSNTRRRSTATSHSRTSSRSTSRRVKRGGGGGGRKGNRGGDRSDSLQKQEQAKQGFFASKNLSGYDNLIDEYQNEHARRIAETFNVFARASHVAEPPVEERRASLTRSQGDIIFANILHGKDEGEGGVEARTARIKQRRVQFLRLTDLLWKNPFEEILVDLSQLEEKPREDGGDSDAEGGSGRVAREEKQVRVDVTSLMQSADLSAIVARFLLHESVTTINQQPANVLSPEEKRQLVAQRRWNFLRICALAGFGTARIDKINQDASKYRCIPIGNVAQGIFMSPRLMAAVPTSGQGAADEGNGPKRIAPPRTGRDGAIPVSTAVVAVSTRRVAYKASEATSLRVTLDLDLAQAGIPVYNVRHTRQ